ncbi:hypothetical protein EDB85DRAFT_1887982 [Lactarius pseudohatsudake]|nr:hypothetical protein EDB85DRAFT_1887982 [Lactarius pseudohatsudake]
MAQPLAQPVNFNQIKQHAIEHLMGLTRQDHAALNMPVMANQGALVKHIEHIVQCLDALQVGVDNLQAMVNHLEEVVNNLDVMVNNLQVGHVMDYLNCTFVIVVVVVGVVSVVDVDTVVLVILAAIGVSVSKGVGIVGRGIVDVVLAAVILAAVVAVVSMLPCRCRRRWGPDGGEGELAYGEGWRWEPQADWQGGGGGDMALRHGDIGENDGNAGKYHGPVGEYQATISEVKVLVGLGGGSVDEGVGEGKAWRGDSRLEVRGQRANLRLAAWKARGAMTMAMARRWRGFLDWCGEEWDLEANNEW